VAQKVAKVGVKKEPGYLYFVDKDGDISRAKMARGAAKKPKKGKKKKKSPEKDSSIAPPVGPATGGSFCLGAETTQP
jgi:hypothetical protein